MEKRYISQAIAREEKDKPMFIRFLLIPTEVLVYPKTWVTKSIQKAVKDFLLLTKTEPCIFPATAISEWAYCMCILRRPKETGVKLRLLWDWELIVRTTILHFIIILKRTKVRFLQLVPEEKEVMIFIKWNELNVATGLQILL